MLALVGCITFQGPGLTPEQQRELETRILDGELENVFHAARSVLQDHGYIIGHTEMASGTITGESAENSKTERVFLGGGCVAKGPAGKDKVTVALEKWAPKKVRARITLLRLIKTTSMSRAAITDKDGTTIIVGTRERGWREELVSDPRAYQLLFDEIKREIFRRESLKEKPQ